MTDQGAPIKLLMTGYMGSGKSFAADYMVAHHHATRWSRTELMKRLAHAVADHVGSPDAVLTRIFPDESVRSEVRDALFAYEYEPEPGKPRRLYQDITEICQEYDPLCFEAELAQRIDAVTECDFSLIDDVRKLVGFEFFSERGYTTLRIEAPEELRKERMLERDGYLPSEETFNHPSETELAGIEHDFVIHNTVPLPEFYGQLDDLVARLRAGNP